MSEEKIKIVSEVLNHPKAASFGSWIAAAIANGANWYVEYASPIVAAIVSILSLVLVITGIRVNTLKQRKLSVDLDQQKPTKEIKNILEKKNDSPNDIKAEKIL
jgi:hypothetical protein